MVGAKFPLLASTLPPARPALLFTSAETVDGERETLIFTGDFYLPTKPEQLSQAGRLG